LILQEFASSNCRRLAKTNALSIPRLVREVDDTHDLWVATDFEAILSNCKPIYGAVRSVLMFG
jgi:hypothetical protein